MANFAGSVGDPSIPSLCFGTAMYEFTLEYFDCLFVPYSGSGLPSACIDTEIPL